ncbi:hypothetical protein [Streptomyces sp. NRRL WC-3618]|uniref:hypothetical protein n=1 Tax=Streptomyces sp. NRRL WC-3618 TaxID=1519490 RepID=UPI001F4163FA|nr:hypothetical protein [Streptomyces sp. NRRL WC-3618]
MTDHEIARQLRISKHTVPFAPRSNRGENGDPAQIRPDTPGNRSRTHRQGVDLHRRTVSWVVLPLDPWVAVPLDLHASKPDVR